MTSTPHPEMHSEKLILYRINQKKKKQEFFCNSIGKDPQFRSNEAFSNMTQKV